MRRPLGWILALTLLPALPACSPSKHSSSSTGCTWPATSTPAADGLAVSFTENDLFAWSASSGRLVGECRPSPDNEITEPSITFDAGAQSVAYRGLQYLLPPVAGPRITAMPDNTATPDDSGPDTGGVRDLHTGKHHDLSFRGWDVASVLGNRLLLVRFDATTHPPTNSSDWCVLPGIDSPRSACTPIPGASGTGTATLAADGDLGWAASAGQPLTIGGVRGYAAPTHGGIVGWSPPTGLGAIVSADQRTVVFPDGRPGVEGRLAWADVSVAGTRLSSTLHQSTHRNAGSVIGLDPGSLGGAFSSGDGSTLDVVERTGQVYRFSATGTPRLLVTLQEPKDSRARFGTGYVLNWPTATSTT